jgi:membrane-bound metal-dependent hydrolase YbcI (DUF457 family)
MPTPIGHALGGLVAGALVAGRGAPDVTIGARRVPVAVVCGLFAMLPDIDFLVGGHRRVTHSLGAVVVAGALVAVIDRRRPAVWIAAGVAYGSHVLLDWLGHDTAPPIGVMALWPFDSAFYQSQYSVFYPVCRQYWLVDCWVSVAGALAWEVALLGPLALAAMLLTRRGRR